MDHERLRALVAIIDTGSFEAAAGALRVTPSAVSQRIKALERDAGQVLVRRGRPCTPTEAGTVLVRLARQVEEVEVDARIALGRLAGAPLQLVVNADSLATWFPAVLSEAAGWTDTELRLRVADEAVSHRLVRSGEAIGAVTTSGERIAGCRTTPLGRMHYLPVAAPRLAQTIGPDGRIPPELPGICFDLEDLLLDRFAAEHDLPRAARRHLVPSSEGFVTALVTGLGWGLAPEPQVTGHLADGSLMRIHPADLVEPLNWQCWSLHSRRLDRLTEAIVRAAGGMLDRGD